MDYYNGGMGPAGFAGGFVQQGPQPGNPAGNMQTQGMQQPFMQAQRAQPDFPGGDGDAELRRFMDEGYLMGPGCFDKDSQTYAKQLMEYINDEFHDHIYYVTLARRAPTQTARRIFHEMAEDELRHARQWAAAYFLITGKRYFPTRNTIGPVNVPSNYSDALRERYMEEGRSALEYRRFASSVSDRCLRRMALETSDDERRHAQEIMRLIQHMR